MTLKQTALRDAKYLKWLRGERCIITGRYTNEFDGVEACHIGTRGRGLKSSDDEALPISHSYHALAHRNGEITMLRQYAPDDVIRAAFRALARELYNRWKAEQ